MTNPANMFAVSIIRKDQTIITLLQTENLEEARRVWQSNVDRWTKCINDRRPFIIGNDINTTAIDPGLISEILVKTIELTSRINPNNPFLQQMNEQGFSNTFGRYTSKNNNPFSTTEELLDKGYQF